LRFDAAGLLVQFYQWWKLLVIRFILKLQFFRKFPELLKFRIKLKKMIFPNSNNAISPGAF
jgi:hypothetical protein